MAVGKNEYLYFAGAYMLTDEKAFSDLKNTINQIAPVPDEQMNALLPLISKAIYKKHEFFTKAGDSQLYIGYVVSGLFRLYYIDLKGKETTKNFLIHNHFVSAYNSLLQGKPSNLFIQALKDSEVLLINYNEWLDLSNLHMC